MFDIVCLASGGLDSTVCLHLLREQKLSTLPVFVNYGQLNYEREWNALSEACARYNFSSPVKFDFPSFGKNVRSGLTDSSLRVKEDAFTPNRNLLFLLLGASIAYSKGVGNIAIGLLAERTTIFPDQTDRFLEYSQRALSESLGIGIQIHSPLRDLTKKDVIAFANARNISNFYSCHAGTEEPCGKCIACLEYN